MVTEIADVGTARPQVLVIGGGVAGASAASRLAEGGAAVTLIEARATLGGRATSYKDGITKQDVDNGQHLLLGAYRDTRAVLRRLGVDQRLKFDKSLSISFVNRSGRRSRLGPRLFSGPRGVLAGLFVFRVLRLKDKLSLVWVLFLAINPPSSGLDGQTVSQWLRSL